MLPSPTLCFDAAAAAISSLIITVTDMRMFDNSKTLSYVY